MNDLTLKDCILTFFKKNNISITDKEIESVNFPDIKLNYSNIENYIKNVLVDTFKLNSSIVKEISNQISSNFKNIGRHEKNLIKEYLDYRDRRVLKELIELIDKTKEKEIIDLIKAKSIDNTNKAVEKFKVTVQNNKNNLSEYIDSLISKLTNYNPSNKTLLDVFKYNENYLKEELSKKSFEKIKKYCSNSKDGKEFYNEYLKLLKEDLLEQSDKNLLFDCLNKNYINHNQFTDLKIESYSTVILNITQKMYDECKNTNEFLDLVFSSIKHSYALVDNYHNLAIYIENIKDKDNKNLKWILFSYIGIFAEHFIPVKSINGFYKPEELVVEEAKYNNIEINEEQKKTLKQYFKNKISKDELQLHFKENIDNILLDFENIWYGFNFQDCISIQNGKYFQSNDIKFIENNNEILLIFNKYRPDERKIPCPDCLGLEVSGNSFPEVGLKSWECKNKICPSRSKSNRGKRYSQKSNFMQFGYENNVDKISPELIKKWKKDIVKINDKSETYEMLIKYFSFSNEEILILNEDKTKIKNFNRKITCLNYSINDLAKTDKKLFNNYINGKYIKRFLSNYKCNYKVDSDFTKKIISCKNSVLINDNCLTTLQKTKANSFDSAVTSPPYYNARMYSQWPNLYLYLKDMDKIIKETFRTLKPGAVYLYNIGDIVGNENTVTKSNMGKKRILLGAYTIFQFISAGFELLDNVLWHKGEPQSYRQNNDGKFTPYYQKPMNVYEHMFLFKKPGKSVINSEKDSIWKSNIAKFTPIIKINSKGKNILGHTAPYPEDIPLFMVKLFNNKNNNIILDPFLGSGTTLYVADDNKIKCIGMEMCKEYCKLITDICEEKNKKIVLF